MPQFIPAKEVFEKGVPKSEKRVYFSLKELLDNDHYVFHSLEWVSSVNDYVKIGEIDFLIYHRKKGIIVCEVKGGRIFQRDNDGKWFSTDKRGNKHWIKDPGKQAQRSARTIEQELRKKPRFRKSNIISVGHCVIFPDTSFPHSVPHIPKDIIIDAPKQEIIDRVISSIYDFWHKRTKHSAFSLEDEQTLFSYLNPIFSVVRKLSWDIRDENKVFLRLTEKQKKYLDFLGNRKRVFVNGRAGSGKTILAMEKASRDVAEGKNTIFLCYNAPLSKYVSRELDGTGVIVNTFHHFVRLTAENAGLEWPEKPDQEFWQRGFMDLYYKAKQKAGSSEFDSVVIDEGQDFDDEWWDVVEEMIADDGSLTIFYDKNQTIRGKFPSYLEAVEPYYLNWNCRSTKEIDKFTSSLIDLEPRTDQTPKGEKPIVQKVSAGKDQIPLLKVIFKQLKSEGISEGQIVILGPHRIENSSLANKRTLGKTRIISIDDNPSSNRIIYSPLRRFKGLESDIIILIDIEFDKIERSLYYVAASRAKNRLFVLGI